MIWYMVWEIFSLKCYLQVDRALSEITQPYPPCDLVWYMMIWYRVWEIFSIRYYLQVDRALSEITQPYPPCDNDGIWWGISNTSVTINIPLTNAQINDNVLTSVEPETSVDQVLYVQKAVTLQKKIFRYICIRKLGLHRFVTITIY